MKKDPDSARYNLLIQENYEQLNADSSLSGKMMALSHQRLEAMYEKSDKTGGKGEILELGCGSIPHINYVKPNYSKYVLSDLVNRPVPDAFKGKATFQKENAAKLSFEDHSFDRIISCNLLEHIPEPQKVIREWMRVLRPNGILSLVLPIDPGVLWRIGRCLGPRKRALAAGIEYDYWMALEHVNSFQNLFALLRYYFEDYEESFFPFFIPIADINLFYLANIRKEA